MTRIGRAIAWWRGHYRTPYAGGVDDPPICRCGHYLMSHGKEGCTGFARDQWLSAGAFRWLLACRCKVQRLSWEVR